MAGWNAEDRSWQLAVSFIAAWRGADTTRRRSAIAQRLAEVSAEGGEPAVEQAVLALTAFGNLFVELYADCEGSSPDAVLREAHALISGNGHPGHNGTG